MAAGTDIDVAKSLGNLEGRVDALTQRVDRMEEELRNDLRVISTKIDELTKAQNVRRGEWNVLSAIGLLVTSLVSGVAAIFTDRWFIHH